MAKGTACGKFILLGEHFVIPREDGTESVPALAFPLHELWCEVKLGPHDHPSYRAILPGEEGRDVIESFMARATYAAANSMRVDVASQPFKVESTSNFPISRGFGSSASFAVALARAFDAFRKELTGQNADWTEIVSATSAVEKIFHGRPSGLDAAVILAGRPIRFENGSVVREISNSAVDFVLVDSGTRDHCSELVKSVSEFRKDNPAVWDRMAGAVKALSDECESVLRSGDAEGVARLVREGHGILAELGLSNPRIDSMIHEAQSFGALGGKVSGAGGGGAVVLLTRKGEGRKFSQTLREMGWPIVASGYVGTEGARE